MHSNSIYLTNFELELLFDKFDKNQDGKITFNEVIFFNKNSLFMKSSLDIVFKRNPTYFF